MLTFNGIINYPDSDLLKEYPNVPVPVGSTYNFPLIDTSLNLVDYDIEKSYYFDQAVVDVDNDDAVNFDNLMNALEAQVQSEVSAHFHTDTLDLEAYFLMYEIGNVFDNHKKSKPKYVYRIYGRLRIKFV